MSRSEHRWWEPSSKEPLLLTPPRRWTQAFSSVDPADAKPPSQAMGSAKMGSLYNIRPGVLGDIHQQTIWSLWDTPARAHLPTAQLDLTLWESMDCSLPGFSAHGILKVGILQWVGILFSRRSSQPRQIFLPSELPGKSPGSKRKLNIPESIV